MEQNKIYKAVFKVNHSGGSGSCFYLRKHNLFVTNYHVVEGFHTVAVQDADRNPYLAHVVLVNPTADIALLEAEGDFSSLPDISIDTHEVNMGQRINVAGYPFGLPFSVTDGTVSSPHQLMGDSYFIQTDAAVNPGNSGGPMFNDRNELIGITVSKFTDADNMGFGIPVETLRKVLDSIGELDRTRFNVQCNSCETLISEEEEYCPSCGEKLPEGIFRERTLTDLALFCEQAIAETGVNPILARVGQEAWQFHKGSSQIRMFVYNGNYLFCTSPINLLPKKDLEPVLTYLVSEDMRPFKLGLDGNQIYIAYRVHISDIFSPHADEVRKNFTKLILKADELDNYLADRFGCEFSEHTRKEAL